jgi:hypothetical protein
MQTVKKRLTVQSFILKTVIGGPPVTEKHTRRKGVVFNKDRPNSWRKQITGVTELTLDRQVVYLKVLSQVRQRRLNL